MEVFTPKPINFTDINGGYRFKNGDAFDANAINAPIESAAYSQRIAAEVKDLFKLAVGKDFDEAVSAIGSVVHPVHSLWFTGSEDDPAELFGGSWEKIIDRVIVGAGGLYPVRSEGGSADAVVVRHKHPFMTYPGGAGSGYSQPSSASTHTQDYTADTEYVGEDGTGKNMPPYKAFYIWYRYA